jgi:hypothetical protein
MEEDGVAGHCPTCSAPHSRGALYCWQCGTMLMERHPSALPAGEQETEAMESLQPAPADGQSLPERDG